MDEHLTLVPVDPFYRIRFHDGRVFDYTRRRRADGGGGAASSRPATSTAIARFVEESQKIFAVGFEQLGDVPFSRVARHAQDRAADDPAALASVGVRRWCRKYIKDDALRVVMSFHPLLVGGNPFTTTSIYTLIAYLERKWGVWFAKGGTGAIVQALVDLFASLGGELELGAAVEEILVEAAASPACGSRGGRTLPADDRRVERRRAGDLQAAVAGERAQEVQRREASIEMRYSMSLFVSYFGTKKQYPDLAHHTILLGPRYRELLDRHLRSQAAGVRLQPLPARTDEDRSVAGAARLRELLRAVAGAASRVGRRLVEARRGISAKRYSSRSNKRSFPGCATTSSRRGSSRRDTFAGELASEKGAAFSIQPVLTQSAYFRFHNKSEDVDGLYLVGAGTHPGAGLPGVLSSAKVVDRLIADVDGTGNTRDPIAGTHAG